ncbi:MAG: DUF5667 domain-containing protein [Candidatus Gracilibacteria bacterium]
MDPNQIENAKKRIWNQMSSKLPDRGLGLYQSVLSDVRSIAVPQVSRLKRVQSKENLLNLLPDRASSGFAFKRVWGLGSLFLVFSFLFMPILQSPPVASADSNNRLEVVEGQVLVNGEMAMESQILEEGDRIETLEGAVAHLYFVDDSRMTLAPETVVDIVDTHVNPENRADTQVSVQQEKGRAWVQVLNLVSQDSYFLVSFPDGFVQVDSRASFDLELAQDTRISIARNLVELRVEGESMSYAGTLGQGAEILLAQGLVETQSIPAEREEDLWWDFNDAYGRTYAQVLDDQYKQETSLHATILPTHPLYFLKTFREDLQVSLALTSGAREELLVQQAEARLTEAQILMAKGEPEAAEEALNEYHNTVQDSLENSDNTVLLAKVELTQKQSLAAAQVDPSSTLLEDHLLSSSALLSSSLEGKTELKMFSASQKLARVPDLIANGKFDQALDELLAYQTSSLSILTELEQVPMEERQGIVSKLLDQKLEDIKLLRVIASMPEVSGALDLDTQLVEQLSMMVLSLKEQQLSDLSNFFENTDYDLSVQYSVYARLKNDTEIDEKLTEQFETVENEIQNSIDGEVSPVIEIEESVSDPEPASEEVLVPHTDEAQE